MFSGEKDSTFIISHSITTSGSRVEYFTHVYELLGIHITNLLLRNIISYVDTVYSPFQRALHELINNSLQNLVHQHLLSLAGVNLVLRKIYVGKLEIYVNTIETLLGIRSAVWSGWTAGFFASFLFFDGFFDCFNFFN